MQVANGEGCARSFSCPYHAWTYDLDGSLKGVPGADGFPGLDLAANGLAEVAAWESGGLVYVMQEAQPGSPLPITVYDFFTPDQVLFHQSKTEDSANWKLLTETLLEGYHIKSLHRESFFPYGFDNTNIVENFGENSRVIYPFKRMEKLRSVAAGPAGHQRDGHAGLPAVSQRQYRRALKAHQRDDHRADQPNRRPTWCPTTSNTGIRKTPAITCGRRSGETWTL